MGLECWGFSGLPPAWGRLLRHAEGSLEVGTESLGIRRSADGRLVRGAETGDFEWDVEGRRWKPLGSTRHFNAWDLIR